MCVFPILIFKEAKKHRRAMLRILVCHIVRISEREDAADAETQKSRCWCGWLVCAHGDSTKQFQHIQVRRRELLTHLHFPALLLVLPFLLWTLKVSVIEASRELSIMSSECSNENQTVWEQTALGNHISTCELSPLLRWPLTGLVGTELVTLFSNCERPCEDNHWIAFWIEMSVFLLLVVFSSTGVLCS